MTTPAPNLHIRVSNGGPNHGRKGVIDRAVECGGHAAFGWLVWVRLEGDVFRTPYTWEEVESATCKQT